MDDYFIIICSAYKDRLFEFIGAYAHNTQGVFVLTFTYTANFTVYSNVHVIYEMALYIREGSLLVLKKRKSYEQWCLINVSFEIRYWLSVRVYSLFIFSTVHTCVILFCILAHITFLEGGGGGGRGGSIMKPCFAIKTIFRCHPMVHRLFSFSFEMGKIE
jgi:hypothetical protein